MLCIILRIKKGERKMNKKMLCIILSLALMLSWIPIASVSAALPRQFELTIGTIGEPYTVDPGLVYDTASSELVWNVYDQLMAFYVNRTEPDRTKQGVADKFEASLAYEWIVDETTDPDHPVYYFKIRGSHDHFITVMSVIPGPIPVPVSSTWMEMPVSEEPGCPWQIWKWEDQQALGQPGYGELSACDIVKMDKLSWHGPIIAPWLAFHVQEYSIVGGFGVMLLKELPVPYQILRTLSLPILPNPVGSMVTEASPVAARQYHIDAWEDGMFGPFNGVLSAGDVITMTRQGAPPVEYPQAWTRDYIVEEITPTQLIVKPCLTCWDIEYSMERWFVLDGAGGPQWMIYEVLAYPDYGWPHLPGDGDIDPTFAPTVDAAIETNCTWVWFTFAIPYATTIFDQVIAQSWASILYTDWAIDQGCWDGNWANANDYHDPAVSPLDDAVVMCGTGPYFFVEWISGSHWRIERFVEHWQQWPARDCLGYLDVIIEEFIAEWPTRKLMFLAGDLDFNYVPRQYKGDVLGKPGINCDFPLEGVVIDGIFYNFNISHTSRYLYPPFTEHLGYGQIKGTGIPPDFFSDVNLRKAFSYCINYTEFQLTAYLGESTYPVTPMPDAGVFAQFRHDPSWYTANQYDLNLLKATYYFKMAWGGIDADGDPNTMDDVTPGLVWTTGFTLPVTYNSGNVPRRAIAEDYLESNIEGINGLFKIDVYDVEWGTVYIPELYAAKLTLFVIGWVPDYLDPHNYIFTFMGSGGAFAYFQRYSDDHVDELIDEGMKSTNTTRRIEIYQELEVIYIRDNPSVCTDQPIGRHWERTWVQGWYYNPTYPGGYFKHYWKAETTVMQPVDLSVMGTMSNVTQVIVTAHSNPPLIDDQKPYLKIVSGPAKGSRPRIIVSVHWERADSNLAMAGFYAVIGLTLQRGATTEHVEGVAVFSIGGPGDQGTTDFILDLATLTAKAYSGRWNCSAYMNVADDTAYDNFLVNNTILDNWAIVLGTGDIYYKDLLGLVDISDLVRMIDAVGTMPGDANWNWYADIYQATIIDNKVDISDLSALVTLVGVTVYTPPI
jgi:peptide/nickel transport system substrate-binding protein